MFQEHYVLHTAGTTSAVTAQPSQFREIMQDASS